MTGAVAMPGPRSAGTNTCEEMGCRYDPPALRVHRPADAIVRRFIPLLLAILIAPVTPRDLRSAPLLGGLGASGGRRGPHPA